VKELTIVLGITGGIAAYKAAMLASLLTKRGAKVLTVMTRSATEFITPLTLQSLTHQPVYTDIFDERDASRITHIDLADSADLIVVAPATADFIARAAHGLGDDLLSTILLATTAPVVLAPAMNVHMYEHPIVLNNLQLLNNVGYYVAEPGVGPLACGYTGKGRLMEPDEIVEFMDMVLTSKRLTGKKVLITAGPTRERIDPVRYLSNDSTGTMGFALAQMAWRMGAIVTLIAGPVAIKPPLGVEVIRVESAAQMQAEVVTRAKDQDVIIMAAAVADYRPAQVSDRKLKKHDGTRSLELIKNPDILMALREAKGPDTYVVGFAAETHDAEFYAQKKLRDKGADMLVLNNVLEPGAGFGAGTNRVTVFFADESVVEVELQPKLGVATKLLTLIADRLPALTV
jgi:phosphopantothenoylcysteine decarboxylase/phosphopantothenate--cysteine ligase